VNRLLNPPPTLPEGMPAWQRFVAVGSHVLLYALMFALPLVGWVMLSAAGYPIVLYGPLQLPPIAPQSPELFATLRTTHTVLALLLFATFLAHLAAALTHALIYRDDVFPSMTATQCRGGWQTGYQSDGQSIAGHLRHCTRPRMRVPPVTAPGCQQWWLPSPNH
jgi:cytochrome b561